MSACAIREIVHDVQSPDGWTLRLRQYVDPLRKEPPTAAVLLVPGLCMNASMLVFHPTGPSFVEQLAKAGLEPWTANLRGQGDARRNSKSAGRVGMQQLVTVDLPTAIEAVLQRQQARCTRICAVGCSLGGSLLYAYLALAPDDHRLLAMATIGAPLRWEKSHPLMWAIRTLPGVVGRTPVVRLRPLVRYAVRLSRLAPALVSPYLTPRHIDLKLGARVADSLDNPEPELVAEMATWLAAKHLVIDGVRVESGLGRSTVPLLCVYGERDGVVPPECVLPIASVMTSSQVTCLPAGGMEDGFAHGDLFVHNHAPEVIFRPVGEWLSAAVRKITAARGD